MMPHGPLIWASYLPLHMSLPQLLWCVVCPLGPGTKHHLHLWGRGDGGGEGESKREREGKEMREGVCVWEGVKSEREKIELHNHNSDVCVA